MRNGLSATIVSIFAAALLSVTLVKLTAPMENVSRNAQGVPMMEESGEFEYVLGEYGGRLAVFSSGSSNPDLVFNVYLQSLPALDRTQLESGITAKDYAELVSLIEDFTS